ncbi:MAG: ComEC/Rec2 family competence protein [Terracidiphilus sp.]
MPATKVTTAPSLAGNTAAPAGAIPLFHAAWLFALGITAAHQTWLRPGYLLIAIVLIAFVCCLAAIRALRMAWVPVALLWCLLGAWCAEMQPQPAPSQDVLALSDNLLRTVDGIITDAGPVRSEIPGDLDETGTDGPTQRIDLRVTSIERVTDEVDRQEPVTGGLRVTVRWLQGAMNPEPFHCGQQIRVVARLLPPEVYHDPGVWSRRDDLLDQGITAITSVRADGVAVTGKAAAHLWPCRVAEVQHALNSRMVTLSSAMHTLPQPLRLSTEDAVMLAAMTTGDRTYLTHALRIGFERTGSFHMLVVSGLHLAIVAGFIFWLLRLLRVPQVPTTLLTIAASCAYALFTGFGTPVQRSLCMVVVYLLGRLLYREAGALNTLGLAALFLLVANPRSLFDSGLQMTLLAVLTIAGIAAPLLQETVHPYITALRDLRVLAIDVKLPPHLAQFRVVMRMIATRLARAASPRMAWQMFPWSVRFLLRIAEAIVVSCLIELAMALPMALYFHRITVFALPVNLFILPLLTLLLPAALLTLVVLLVWPAAAILPASLAALLMHISVGLVRFFGSPARGDFRIPTPLRWQILLFVLLLAAAIALARQANRTSKRWLRPAAWACMVLAALIAVAPRPIDHPRNALLVEAIDVGQGDSILLITPDGKTMLVDGGGFSGGPHASAQNFDIGEEVVSAALWSRGIRHLDVVALTHAHSDHLGGLPALLRNFHPDALWVGNNPSVPAYDALLAEAAELKIPVRALHAGETASLGDAQVRVLAPMADYRPGAEPANNDSLVLHVAYGATSVLLEGDAEAPIEQAMLNEHGLQSTLLKVGHHGSISSTTPEFLARVAPQWAVISCGLHNRYGHPREEVLAALQAAGARTYSTDINGAACFRLNGRSVTPDPFCGQDRQP